MNQATHDAFSHTVGRFYDAAYGAASWTGALAGLTTLFHGSRSWLFHTRPASVEGHTSLADPDFHTDAARQAILRDPFFLSCRQLPPGKVVLHSEMHDIGSLRRRELWQDWLRPRDLYFGMQCLLRISGDDHFLIDVSRDARRGEFGDEHRALMRRLMPHMARAGEISAIIAGGTVSKHGPVAMVVVDRTLRVVEANDAAHRLLEEHASSICLSGNRLCVAGAAASRRLHDLAAMCIASDAASPPPTGFAIIAGADDEPSPALIATVCPHTLFRPFGFPGEHHAAVFLRPVHGSGGEALDDALMSLFDLKPSQARLARTLAAGIPLRQAAAERGLSYASARTYLEHIFRQTGTSRQPQLVALLKTIAAALPS